MFSIPGKKPPRTAPDEPRPPSPLSLPPAASVPSSSAPRRVNPVELRSSLADRDASDSPTRPIKRAKAAQLPSQAALFPATHSGSSGPSIPRREAPSDVQAAHPTRAAGARQDSKQGCAAAQEADQAQVSEASDEEQPPHGAWRLTGWALASHGQTVRLTIDSKQVHADYTDQDRGLLLAGPDQPASALFSTGFACCVAIVLVGERDVGLVHTSLVDEDLSQRIVSLQRQFRRETGRAPECTNLVRFEDGLREALALEQAQDRKEFGSSMSLEIGRGRRLLSQIRPEGAPPAAERPSAIDAVVEHFRDLACKAADACGVSLISLPGQSIFVDQAGTIRSFVDKPPFDPLPESPESSADGD